MGRIITTLPSIRNPIPVGPPVIDQVPTRIIARPNGGFYIATLTGFPFNSGAATIYRMTEAGVVTPYKTGLTMLTDLAVDESTGDLYALQFARFSLQIFNTLPNSSTITRIKPNGTTEVVAEGFGPSSGMALDKDGNIFVTEIFSGRVLKFSGLVTRNISFSVDMSNQRISSRGVYMAHDLNGWKPNAVRMTDMGNNIYKATVSVPQSTPLRYKFMNGDTWGTNEDVPIGCGMTNAQGGVDRVFRATTVDSFSVGTVCFSSCIQCGNTRPQTSFFYCPRDPNLIVCDNFESYQYDKLVPQASHWTTLGLALDGTTLSNTRDNPNVAGFWNGYANYDGTRAMRVRSDFYNNVADEPMLYLGNPREGRYEMSFKIYISKNKSAVISFMDTTDVSNVWHFTLDFSKGNLYILETLDIGTELPSTPVAYRSNDWNDVSIVFNAATKKMTVKLNNSSVFNAVVASQGSFPFLDFNTYDAISGYTNESEYFIDDLVYRRIANTESLLPQTGANTSAYRSISPNPANETMVFATDDQTKGDWQVRLINTVGQVVFQKNGTDAQSIDISTAAYKTGIYVVEFKSDSEHWTQKVVIQH